MQSHFFHFCSQFGTEYGIATRTNRHYRDINASVTGTRRVDSKTGPSPTSVMMSFQKSSHNKEAFKISGIHCRSCLYLLLSFPRTLWNVYKLLINETPEFGDRNVYF